MRSAGMDEAQAGIKIARKISITSDMQMTLIAESEGEPKICLMKVKEENEKAG